MAASQEQKVDFLLKKIGYTASKSGIAEDSSLSGTKKAPFAEPIPSPLVIANSSLWAESSQIPGTPPTSTTDFVGIYTAGTSGFRMTVDSTVSGNRTFIARSSWAIDSSSNSGDWIDTQFGSDYIVKVWMGDPSGISTSLSAAGSGSNDTWFFDYSSGILNFNGTAVPTGVTTSNIYLTGYRYKGIKGAIPPGAAATVTSLLATGITTFAGAIDANSTLDVDGDTQLDDLNVTGVATFSALVDVNNRIDVVGGANIDQLNVAGVSTYAGTSKFDGLVDVNNRIDVVGGANIDQLNVSGVSTIGNVLIGGGTTDLVVNGNARVTGVITSGTDSVTIDGPAGNITLSGGIIATGIITGTTGTFTGTINAKNFTGGGSTITAAGAEVTQLEVAGLSTFKGAVDINAAIDADYGANIAGGLTADQLNVPGVSTFVGNAQFDSNVSFGDSDKAIFGAGTDLTIYSDGTSGKIQGKDGEDSVVITGDAGVEIYYDNSLKFKTVGTGVSIANGVTTTATLFGPENIIIDPAPAGIGTTSGNVRIKGDLYVEGSQFIVDSEHIHLGDFVVGIATTVTTDALTDGAGIGIGSIGHEKTFLYEYNSGSNPSLKASENLNVASGKGYQIAETSVLNATTLGTGVVNSSLTSVGTLTGLTVSGAIDANGSLDVDGDTQVDDLNVAGVATFSSNIKVGTGVTIDTNGQATYTGIVTALSFRGDGGSLTGITAGVPGISTTGDSEFTNISVNGGANISGVTTIGGLLDVNNRLDVVGGANIDQANVSGVSTYAGTAKFDGLVDVNNRIDVVGGANIDQLNVSGVSTYAGTAKFDGLVDVNNRIDVVGGANIDQANVTGVSTYSALVDVNNRLDVVGGANIDQANVSGVSTFGGVVDINAAIDADYSADISGGLTVDVLNVTGVSTLGSPGLTLDINSAIDADYGANIAGGSYLDNLYVAGVTTTNGLLDVNNRLDVVGGANIDQANVSGVSTFGGVVDINAAIDADYGANIAGGLTVDQANISGVSTFGGTLDINAAIDADYGANIAGGLTADHANVAGVGSFNSLDIATDVDVDGTLEADAITVDGSTLATVIAGTTVTNATNAAHVLVTDNEATSENNLITFVENAQSGTANHGLEMDGDLTYNPGASKLNVVNIGATGLNASGVVTASSFIGSGASLTGVGTQGGNIEATTLTVTGISTFYNDINMAGTASTAGNKIAIGYTTLNNGTINFEGSEGQLFSITNNLTDGSIFSVNDVSGMPSIDVGAAGTIQLAPYGSGELVGIGTTRPTSKLDVVGDVQVVGVVTATSFSGDGSSLTGVTLTDGSFIGLNVTGVSTFGGTLDINAAIDADYGANIAGGLTADHANVAGVGSFNSLDIGTDIDVDGTCEADAYTVNGTALDTHIAGVTVTNSTNSAHVYVTDNESTSENNLVAFVENAQTSSGNHGLEMDGNFTYNPSSGTVTATAFAGDLTGDVTGTADDATNAAHVYVTDNESTAENNLITFVENAQTSSGNHGLEMDGNFTYTPSTGTVTATLFSGSGASLTNIPTGINTAGTSTFKDIVVTGGINASGVVTASSFSGDGSALTGIEAGGTGDFYVGFTSSVTMNPTSYETTVHTFASTASKTYVIDSIMAANVANVGIGTTVNLIASISSNSGVAAGTTEQAYIAYNVPLAPGGAVELIKEPLIANPNDIVKMWATNAEYVGIASAIQVHMTYTQQDSTDFFGKYAGTVSIANTAITGIYTASPTYSSTIQSVHITNRSAAGDYPVDIMFTDTTGVSTTYLVKNLVIPKYSSVEILERPKRMEVGSTLGVKVQQTGTIDVVVSGKQYS